MFRSCFKTHICLQGDALSHLCTWEGWDLATCRCTPCLRCIQLSTDHEVAAPLSMRVMSQSCLSWSTLKQEHLWKALSQDPREVVLGCLRRVLNWRAGPVLVSKLSSLHSNVVSFLPAAFEIWFHILLIVLPLWRIPDSEHHFCQKRCSIEISSAH